MTEDYANEITSTADRAVTGIDVGLQETDSRQIASLEEFESRLRHELLTRALLSDELLQEALLCQQGKNCTLTEAILEMELLESETMLTLGGELLSTPAVDLSVTPGDVRVLENIPREKAFQLGAIPLFAIENQLIVAMADPFDLQKLDTLRFITSQDVLPAYAIASDIRRHLTRYYGDYDALFDPFEIEFESTAEEPDASVSIEDLESEQPTVRLVNLILSSCIAEGATDIHLEPHSQFMAVRSRMDDILRVKPYQIPKSAAPGVISRIKVLGGLDITEKRRPQDGKMGVHFQTRKVDVRISTFPTIHGEKIVLRLLDKERTDFQLETIGMEPKMLERWQRLVGHREGIVLVTGPTGSGKSSTLYASLRHLHRPEVNIVTLEDPVEYELDGIAQGQVRPAAGFTFASGLRAILRQDPDIIQVGEIRDLETAEIAARAALTGHLVLATLHTNNAPAAVTRLIDIGVQPYLVASALRGVVAQRLVRRACPACLEIVEPSAAESRELERLKCTDLDFKDGVGCSECQDAGYKGRVGVYELLEVDSVLAGEISAGATDQQLAKIAAESGYASMWADGFAKVEDDRTTLRELLRVLPRDETGGTRS